MRLSRKAKDVLDRIGSSHHDDARAFAEEVLAGPLGAQTNADTRLANLCRAYLVLHVKAWPSDFE